MPITASAEFAEEVEGVEYRRAATLTIYPPASDYLDFTHALSSVNLTAAMTSPLPDNARIQAGGEAITAEFVLGGSIDVADETVDAADFFDPDNPDSPLYHLQLNGCRITFEWGAYVPGSATPETPGQLLAWVNGVDFDWDARTATIHAVDLDPDWDAKPQLPAVITDAPYNARLTTEFAMDRLIRFVKGASCWPDLRDDVLLAVGLRASLWPQVGTLFGQTTFNGNPFRQLPPTFATGVNGSGLLIKATGLLFDPDTSTFIESDFRWPFEGSAGADLFAEFDFTALQQVNIAGGPDPASFALNFDNAGADEPQALLKVDHSGITVQCGGDNSFGSESTFFSIPVDDGPHHLAVQIHWPFTGSSFDCWIELDGVKHTATGVSTGGGPRLATEVFSHAFVTGDIDDIAILNSLQVTGEDSTAVSNYGFVPIAVLDPSLNPLTVVPAMDPDAKAWDEMVTMAAAECGYVRRVNGLIVFTNRLNLLNQPVARTISGDSSLGPLSTSIQPASANHAVNVSYTEWDFGKAGLVWTLGNKKKIAANQITTWTHDITDGTLVAQVDGTVSLLGNTTVPGHDGNSQYLMSLDKDGVNEHPGLRSLTITQLTATTFQISADNRHRPAGYFVVPSSYTGTEVDLGDPALWIGGIPVTSGDTATVTVSSGDGKNPVDFDSNNYLQDHDTAYAVGLFVLRQCRWDVREITDAPIVPDPRILCGDLDRLVESTRSKVNDYVMVWGYTFTATFPPPGSNDTGTWSQTLSARSLGPPDSYLGGAIPDRAEAGVQWAY